MQTKKLNVRIVCDMPMCNNMASYKFVHDNGSDYNSLNLCDECIKELSGQFGKIITPKSPKNVLNKNSSTIKELQ